MAEREILGRLNGAQPRPVGVQLFPPLVVEVEDDAFEDEREVRRWYRPPRLVEPVSLRLVVVRWVTAVLEMPRGTGLVLVREVEVVSLKEASLRIDDL